MQNNLPTIATHVHHSVCNPKDEYNKKAMAERQAAYDTQTENEESSKEQPP